MKYILNEYIIGIFQTLKYKQNVQFFNEITGHFYSLN